RLSLLGRESLPTGLVDRVANTLAELRTHGFSPDDVREMAQSLPPGVSPILTSEQADLALLYDDYIKSTVPCYTDVDWLMSDAAASLHQVSWLQGVQIWVDGFAGFTPMEYRMLTALIGVAGRVSVALCLDPASNGSDLRADGSLFQRPTEAYQLLSGLARRTG